MKKLLLFFLICGYAFSQTNCELCVETGGFYCGDDESNWTQYSPLGCVPNGLNGLQYLNDGWDDCVNGADEANAVPTTLADCGLYGETCDTVYIEVPVIQIDTIVETIIETEYITDTIVEIEYVDVVTIEYVDCDSGLPCSSGMGEAIDKSKTNNKMYSLLGYEIKRPEGVYIQNGKIKYKLN